MEFLGHRHGLKPGPDGKIHSQDLLALRVHQEVKLQGKKSLTTLDPTDDHFEILFKHYETLKNYMSDMHILGKKIASYRKD